MLEIRIPSEGLTGEGFVALKAQMRILFGMPAEVMPHSRVELYNTLRASLRGDISSSYPLRRWCTENGYEILADIYTDFGSRRFGDYVIRQTNFEDRFWVGYLNNKDGTVTLLERMGVKW